MVRLISDIDRAFQCLDHLLIIVRNNILMSCKVVVWVILDIHPISRFEPPPTWISPPFSN